VAKLSVVFAGLTLILMAACQSRVEVEVEPTVDVAAEMAAVEVVLDSYVASVETEDIELYAKNVAHDTAMVNFGGFGEPIVGRGALKQLMERQNEALSETDISVSDLAIHVGEDGKLAWATCLWDLKAVMGENPIELPIRCTWVLEKRGARWVIAHFHKSMAAPTG
jgi:uncharacterized protein (TIGR02246 family)